MGQRRLVLSIVTLTLLSAGLVSPALAQKKGKGGGGKQSCKSGSVLLNPIPVTITFLENDGDKIKDDANDPDAIIINPYGAEANAVIDCGGRFWMSSSWPEPGTREISLDFSNGPEPPFYDSVGDVVVTPFSFKSRVLKTEDQVNLDDCAEISSPLDIPDEKSCLANFNVTFDDPAGGKWDYAVRINPVESWNAVLVTRADKNTWNIVAEPPAGADAALIQYVRNKAEFHGLYSMPFHATVDCQNTDEQTNECLP